MPHRNLDLKGLDSMFKTKLKKQIKPKEEVEIPKEEQKEISEDEFSYRVSTSVEEHYMYDCRETLCIQLYVVNKRKKIEFNKCIIRANVIGNRFAEVSQYKKVLELTKMSDETFEEEVIKVEIIKHLKDKRKEENDKNKIDKIIRSLNRKGTIIVKEEE